MRSRVALLVLLLGLPALAGCVDAADRALRGEPDDAPLAQPSSRTYAFSTSNVTIETSDGVPLRATLYQPDPYEVGERFPVVVFVHGWGGDRGASPDEAPYVAQMRTFAREGYVVLAYDVRGFGESGGRSTLAGPREMQDLAEVIDWTVNATAWSGKLGIVGRSYGGAHAMWGLVHDPRVTTAVNHYGWIDLAEGLAPGGIPKQWWVAALLLVGARGGGEYDPVLAEWARAAMTREDFDAVLDALDARSTWRELPDVTKPVLLVEGLDETLFPQALRAYDLLDNASMRKVFLYDGGHGSFSEEAWERTRLWFDLHLKGEASGADGWPAVAYTAPWDGRAASFADFPLPDARERVLYLVDETPADGEGALADAPGAKSRARFTGSVRSGATDDPSVLRDANGARGPDAPTRLRAAPGEAVLLRGEPLANASLLVGAPRVHLALEGATPDYQVVARLYDEAPDGRSVLLARGGLDPTPAPGPTEVAFELTPAFARVEAGHRLVLVLAGDDASYSAPYPRPFTAEALLGGEGARLVFAQAPAAR